MRYISLFALLSFVFVSCGGGKSNTAFITGTVKDADGQYVYLEELNFQKTNVIDSCKVENGKFTIKKKAGAMNYYQLRLGNYVVQTAQNTAPTNLIILLTDSSETITVDADGKNFNIKPTIKGSRQTTLLEQLNAEILKGESVIDSVNAVYNSDRENFDMASAEKTVANVMTSRISYMKKFIDEHPTDFVCLQALAMLNTDADYEYFKKVSENLSIALPKNGWVMNLKERVSQLGNIVIGNEAPDFTIKTPNDENISLKSFRGKFVLVDFWASWCKPCLEENPVVVSAYAKFKSKNFEVFGVSLDQNKQAWIDAIAKNKMTWKHGSDLQFWDSAPAIMYNVQSIPYNILVDPQGKIIAKNLRGEQLDQKLTEVL